MGMLFLGFFLGFGFFLWVFLWKGLFFVFFWLVGFCGWVFGSSLYVGSVVGVGFRESD